MHFFTQSSSSFLNTCPYHQSLFGCNTNAMSSIPNLFLSSLLGNLSFSLNPHIHRTILISAYQPGRIRINILHVLKSSCSSSDTHTHTHTGSAGTKWVKPIWILLEQEIVSGSGISWACASLHLTPDRQPRQHLTTQFFTGRMPFLPPNQQRQSTKGQSTEGHSSSDIKVISF